MIKVKKQQTTSKRVSEPSQNPPSLPSTTSTTTTSTTPNTTAISTVDLTASNSSLQRFSSIQTNIATPPNTTFVASSIRSSTDNNTAYISINSLINNNSISSVNTSCLETISDLNNSTTYNKMTLIKPTLKISEEHHRKQADNLTLPIKPIVINVDELDNKSTNTYNIGANNIKDNTNLKSTKSINNSNNIANIIITSNADFTTIKALTSPERSVSLINLADESENNNNINTNTSINNMPSLTDIAVKIATSKVSYSNQEQVSINSHHNISPSQESLMKHAQQFSKQQPKQILKPQLSSNNNQTTYLPTFAISDPKQLSPSPQHMQQYLQQLQHNTNKSQHKGITPLSPTIPAFKRPSIGANHDYNHLNKNNVLAPTTSIATNTSTHQSEAMQQIKMQQLKQQPTISQQQFPLPHPQLLPNTSLGFNKPQ